MRKVFMVISSIFLLVTLVSMDSKVQASEKYPVKPIMAICPLEPGSGGDLFWRPLCQKASAVLGQPIVVVNKPGAGSSIG